MKRNVRLKKALVSPSLQLKHENTSVRLIERQVAEATHLGYELRTDITSRLFKN